MSFYQANLAVFAAGNAYLLYRQYRRSQGTSQTPQIVVKDVSTPIDDDDDAGSSSALGDAELLAGQPSSDLREAVRRFKLDYFLVYGLAVAADWLQGPHIYAIYKYEKQLPERTVAALYAAGFISGALSASVAGELADRYGRRLACLVYCAAYTLTCLSMLSDDLIMLFVGRLCGGVATTLLFSVFEAWLITEYHERGLSRSELTLSEIFAYMTTLSCVVAIVSGVAGDALVTQLGSRVWPFVASIVCCAAAGWLMLRRWHENYGTKSSTGGSLTDIKSGIQTILQDKRILALGAASCFFESAMYLFIFFWSAALKSARLKSSPTSSEGAEDLPFGLIFSSFMCAMMAGSALFSLSTPSGSQHTKESTTYILTLVLLLMSCCLSTSTLLSNEHMLFWTMCLVEACVGAYFPSMSFLKSEVVDDGVRGRVYSILRFPLNVYVVVTHALDEEGDGHRNRVFMTCAFLLMVAFFVVRRNFSA